MFLVLLATLTATATPCSETMFEFAGQPKCVELSYADGQTQLTNSCEHALLIDQSVQLPASAKPAKPIPAKTSTKIRDLSAFTMGMNGKLYRVVANVRDSCEETVADTAPNLDTGP